MHLHKQINVLIFQFTQSGGITVKFTLSSRDDSLAEEQLEVSVIDTGIGIDSHLIESFSTFTSNSLSKCEYGHRKYHLSQPLPSKILYEILRRISLFLTLSKTGSSYQSFPTTVPNFLLAKLVSGSSSATYWSSYLEETGLCKYDNLYQKFLGSVFLFSFFTFLFYFCRQSKRMTYGRCMSRTTPNPAKLIFYSFFLFGCFFFKTRLPANFLLLITFPSAQVPKGQSAKSPKSIINFINR